jgi:hypothetical protein
MKKAARRRPLIGARPIYFIAPDEAVVAAVAAAFADDAASIADVAADDAAIEAPIAADDASADGVVMTVVVDGVVTAGVVVVVVVSSFLLQAANERAAARVTISSAVFMFLLDVIRTMTGGTLLQ